ncbi:MAG: hypothetical protein R2828_15270 [Saprospiraceae bacterium]
MMKTEKLKSISKNLKGLKKICNKLMEESEEEIKKEKFDDKYLRELLGLMVRQAQKIRAEVHMYQLRKQLDCKMEKEDIGSCQPSVYIAMEEVTEETSHPKYSEGISQKLVY